MNTHFEQKKILRGCKKGGGGQQEPARLEPPSPDTIEDCIIGNTAFEAVDIICEGPIDSFVDSAGNNTENIAEAIYLDDTPVRGLSGSYNFQNVLVDARYGYSDQSAMRTINRPCMEYNIGKRLFGALDYSTQGVNHNAKWGFGSVDVNRGGDAEKSKNFSDWFDRTANYIPEEASPITHIIKDKNCSCFAITITIEQLYDTCCVDGLSDKTLRRMGDQRIFGFSPSASGVLTENKAKEYKAGQNYATIVAFVVEYGRVLSNGEEEMQERKLFNIYGLCMSPTYIDFGSNLNSGDNPYKQFYGIYDYGKTSNMRYFQFPSNWNEEDTVYKWIRVRRTTPESQSSLVKRSISLSKVTEFSPVFLRYPLCALGAIKSDARTFSQVPKRAYMVRMTRILTPNNYQPMRSERRWIDGAWKETKMDRRRYKKASEKLSGEDLVVYAKGWDYRSFKKQWTDNPVWIILDLLTNSRYGLGSYISLDRGDGESDIDLFSFYDVARYCDGVDEEGLFIGFPNGFGGLEPRFSISMIMRDRMNSIEIISSILSVIDASLYWNNGKISLSHKEERRKIRALFNNRNVIDGVFNYTSTRRDERYNVAEVNYSDEMDLYKTKIEYCTNESDLKENGISKISMNAYGCCSKGMAQRVGNRFLTQNALSINIVSFATGHEALFLQLNDMFLVDDELINLAENYARISSIEDTNPNTSLGTINITLDRELESSRVVVKNKIKAFFYWSDPNEAFGEQGELSPDNTFPFNISNFTIGEGKTVLRIAKNDKNAGAIILNAEGFYLGSVVSVEVLDKSTRKYRVASIKESEEGIFEVMGQYVSDEQYASLAVTQHYQHISKSMGIPLISNNVNEISSFAMAESMSSNPQDMADEKYDEMMGILKAPSTLTITRRGTILSGYLKASWSAVPMAKAYRIVVKNSLNQTYVSNETTSREFEFSAVEDRYIFSVWTINADDKESRYPITKTYYFVDEEMLNRSPEITLLTAQNSQGIL